MVGEEERIRGRGRRRRTVGSKCLSEIYAVSTKSSFMQKNRRFIGLDDQPHSGDMSVPYGSLSFSHTWLNQTCESIRRASVRKGAAVDAASCPLSYEYRPQRMHRHVFDSWAPTKRLASAVATVDPATEIFSTAAKDGRTTVIMELDGEDHQEILKSPFLHKTLFQLLDKYMYEDLNPLHHLQNESEWRMAWNAQFKIDNYYQQEPEPDEGLSSDTASSTTPQGTASGWTSVRGNFEQASRALQQTDKFIKSISSTVRNALKQRSGLFDIAFGSFLLIAPLLL